MLVHTQEYVLAPSVEIMWRSMKENYMQPIRYTKQFEQATSWASLKKSAGRGVREEIEPVSKNKGQFDLVLVNSDK